LPFSFSQFFLCSAALCICWAQWWPMGFVEHLALEAERQANRCTKKQRLLSIVVYGCGKVGSAIAVVLANHGLQPIVVARGGRLARLKVHGVVLHGWEDETLVATPSQMILASPEDLPQVAPDIVVVCLRRSHLDSAMADLRNWIHSGTTVLSVQGGIPYWYCHGADPALADESRSLVSSCGTDSASEAFLSIGHTHIGFLPDFEVHERPTQSYASHGGAIDVFCRGSHGVTLGAVGSDIGSKVAVAEIAALLPAAGFAEIRVSEEPRRDVWVRILRDSLPTAVCALTRQSLVYVREAPCTRRLLRNCELELLQIGERLGLLKSSDHPAITSQDNRRSSLHEKNGNKLRLDDKEVGQVFEFEPFLTAAMNLAAVVHVDAPCLAVLRDLAEARADAMASTRGIRHGPEFVGV